MADQKPDVKPAAGGTVQQVSLKLRDQQNNEIEFKVKSTTKFQKIAKAYADKKGVDVNSLRFNLDGDRVDIQSEQTVADLGLEDGDSIDVTTFQVGGRAL
ncbi:Small ubiquitin- modifier 3 [Allomyces javanicus]|nr:Small ubiquitin- modifier 3 [Allomyces javanicus]